MSRSMDGVHWLESLRGVVSDYGEFCRAAESLPWMDVQEWHRRWQTPYPLGLMFDAYRFPPGYVRKNPVQAYVRTILSGIGFWEEWEPDFWDAPQAERARWLAEGRSLYENYAIVRDVRLIRRSWEDLAEEIAYFAQGNRLESSRQKGFMQQLQGADALEIGGSGPGDYVYLAVKGDGMLLISCGFWD